MSAFGGKADIAWTYYSHALLGGEWVQRDHR
jgi:hypothetical protein